MMKLCACLALVLYVLVQHHADAAPLAIASPKDCCFNFYTGDIPSDRIVSVLQIHSGCANPGFIVKTKKGISICMGPDFQLKPKA
ncbi:hypothetical protein SKAU_G00312210 [Synaphobranchus kaupii]|uniref:Chemokine interleukin-8-like domain-containing protein n=1 Tax=Synaphobranchus kaupii TaxID=118154 RepID=A0A9Q1ES03_SYNKA|nr:hypothetical protein SKAU_G00312210 [Synaphobranchus kaupii]